MLENVSIPEYLALSWIENANCFLKEKTQWHLAGLVKEYATFDFGW